MELPEDPAPLAWSPLLPVCSRSSMADILNVMGFGSEESKQSYGRIMNKFTARKIDTAGKLKDYSGEELVSMLRPLELQKKPRLYVAAIGGAIGHDFFKTSVVKSESGERLAAAGQGAEWHLKCTKVEAGAEFNPTKYIPDGRVYAALPALSKCDQLDSPDAKLAVDLVW